MRSSSIGTWLLALLVVGAIGVSYYLGVRDAKRLGQQYAQAEIATMLDLLREKDNAFFEIERNAAEELSKARDDLDVARTTLSRVREHFSTCPNPPPFLPGTTADQTEGVRAYVLDQIETRLSVLARFADESFTAAAVCRARTNLFANTTPVR